MTLRYFDYNATTPLDKSVKQVLRSQLKLENDVDVSLMFGNPVFDKLI